MIKLLLTLMMLCFLKNAFSATNIDVITKEDESGNITYTNILPSDNTSELPKEDIQQQAIAIPDSSAKKAKLSTISKFKISPEVQSRRDDKRRVILSNELDDEKQALILSQSKNDQIEIEAHTRNISLLKKELGVPN